MDLLEYTPLLDDAGQPIPCSELSNMQYTSSEDTEGEAAPGDHAESSRSRYLATRMMMMKRARAPPPSTQRQPSLRALSQRPPLLLLRVMLLAPTLLL